MTLSPLSHPYVIAITFSRDDWANSSQKLRLQYSDSLPACGASLDSLAVSEHCPVT
jgi:hypothetical protein